MWTAFNDSDDLASASHASGSHAPFHTATTPPPISTLQRRHPGWPASHDISIVLFAHSKRDSFSVDYDLWPFDGMAYAIACAVMNYMVHTALSLWTPLVTEDDRRHAFVQYSDRCCDSGSTEHIIRWCPAVFRIAISLYKSEFAKNDPDGSVFKTWRQKMKHWRRRGYQHRHQLTR